MDIAEIINKKTRLDEEIKQLHSMTIKNQQYENHVVEVLSNTSSYLSKIESQFKKGVSLTKSDKYVLTLAISMQMLRLYLLPNHLKKFEENKRVKHNDPEIKNRLAQKANSFIETKKKSGWEVVKSTKNYPTWEEIILGNHGVGYDKTAGSKDFGLNMHGPLHRVKTIAHSPSADGWFFGIANILSNTITVTPEFKLGETENKTFSLLAVRSFQIENGRWSYEIPTYNLCTDSVLHNALESISEDNKRLFAASFAHANHIYSDKYTVEGLPIPYLSMINADKAFELYKSEYDWLDLQYDIKKNISSAVVTQLINKLISLIHFCFFNPQNDNMELFAARTRKIILISNLIATGADTIKTAIRISAKDKNALRDFDWGSTVITFIKSIEYYKYVKEIKDEFIFNEYKRIINNLNY